MSNPFDTFGSEIQAALPPVAPPPAEQQPASSAYGMMNSALPPMGGQAPAAPNPYGVGQPQYGAPPPDDKPHGAPLAPNPYGAPPEANGFGATGGMPAMNFSMPPAGAAPSYGGPEANNPYATPSAFGATNPYGAPEPAPANSYGAPPPNPASANANPYGAPVQDTSATPNPYGAPTQDTSNPYGVPPQDSANPYGAPPQEAPAPNPYGGPPQEASAPSPYGAPPQEAPAPNPYGAPPANPYGAPPGQPPANPYGAPPQEPSNLYGATPDAGNPYGAPPPADQSANPYGAPPPSDQPVNPYGAPPSDQPANPYGAPPPQNAFGAPSHQPPYGAPDPSNPYGVAPAPYGAQPQQQQGMVPYGAPANPYGAPGAFDPSGGGALVVSQQQSNPYAGYAQPAQQAIVPVDPFSVFSGQSQQPPAPTHQPPPPQQHQQQQAPAPASDDDFWGSFGSPQPDAAQPAPAADRDASGDAAASGGNARGEEGLPPGGEWYDARIFTPTLGVMFFKPQELTDSLFLNTDKDVVDGLGERPVVAFIVEGSSARSAGVELGHVLLKVNGVDVKSPKEASRLIKEGPRPLPLLFYVPNSDVVIAEGEHMVKYDTRETTAPNSAKDWKPKYVVIGGIIAQPWMMNMYRSKSEYDIAVIETQARRPVSVKVKQFSLQGSRIQNDWQGPQMVKYKNKLHPWKFIVVLPVGRNPIKISSPNLSQLKPVHEGIRRVLLAQQRGGNNRGGGGHTAQHDYGRSHNQEYQHQQQQNQYAQHQHAPRQQPQQQQAYGY